MTPSEVVSEIGLGPNSYTFEVVYTDDLSDGVSVEVEELVPIEHNPQVFWHFSIV